LIALTECSSILYFEPSQTDQHADIASSSRAGVSAHFERGGRHMESWLHCKITNAIFQFQAATYLQKTYELVIGRPPFEAFFDDKDLVSQFQKVIGGVPEKWVQDALSNGVLKEGINGELLLKG
jgi:hypothetical protein